MELTGILKVKNETQSFGSNGFTKREFVIETEDQYPQSIQLELIKDKCSLIDTIAIGDKITAKINVKGRKWTNKEGIDKYFNSIEAWKIEKVGEAAPEPQAAAQDDLPF